MKTSLNLISDWNTYTLPRLQEIIEEYEYLANSSTASLGSNSLHFQIITHMLQDEVIVSRDYIKDELIPRMIKNEKIATLAYQQSKDRIEIYLAQLKFAVDLYRRYEGYHLLG